MPPGHRLLATAPVEYHCSQAVAYRQPVH